MNTCCKIALLVLLCNGSPYSQPALPYLQLGQNYLQKSHLIVSDKRFHSPRPRVGLSAATDSGFSILSRWGWGACYAVAQDSPFVVVGNGSLLQVLAWDAKTNSLSKVSECDMLMPIFQIRIRDSLAYIIGGAILAIVDVRDPNQIKPLGSLQVPDILLTLELVDSIAYMTTWFGNLYLSDIRDPLTPRLISRALLYSERAGALAVKNGYCYTGGLDTPLLYVYDVRKPDSVKYVRFVETGGLPLYAAIRDTVLIVGAKNTATIQFYSLATPDTPAYISGLNLPGIDTFYINDLKSAGPHLYVSTDISGFFDIDLTDSAQPFIAMHRFFPYGTSSGGSVTTSTTGLLYVACDNGLAIYNALDSLSYAGFYPTAGTIAKMSIRGNLAAVAATTGGLWLLDISDPRRPKQISNINNGGNTFDVTFSSNRLIMYDAQLWDVRHVNGGVYIYDISDSTTPKLLSTFAPPPLDFNADDGVTMCLDSNLLFLAQQQAPNPPHTYVEIVDIADPLHPYQVLQVTLPFFVTRMAARGGALYVASRGNGLSIFDYRSLPSFPRVDSVLSGGTIFSVTLDDSVMFLRTGGDISVYDILQPATPELVSSFIVNSTAPPPYDLPLAGNFLYCQIVGTSSGIAAIDAADRHRFGIRGFIEEIGASALGASDGYLLVAWPEVGITLYHNDLVLDVKPVKPPAAPTSYRLEQNFPNPFNPATTITYEIPSSSMVDLTIHDLLGREIATLVDEIQPAGTYRIHWATRNAASGIYFYQLTARPRNGKSQPFVFVKKMVFTK